MLKHKKGITLVELMIVVALLGFGAVALANLFQSAFRTFNKTEERYIKQEAVKSVAEYLQNGTNIGVATKAEIYPDASVVPTGNKTDGSYAYIYVEKKDLLPKGDPAGDGVYDGYYLYKLERGQKREDAVCLNEEIPLYITFSVYKDEDFAGAGTIENQCGVKVNIAAVDSDFNYGKVGDVAETNEALNARIKDYIFYDMDVSYHFPNMIANKDQFRVNYTGNQIDTATDYVNGGSQQASDTGCVLRLYIDASISEKDIASALSVSSFCFIATAGYGEATGEVGILCDFRDQCLKTNPLGRMFVKAYYTISPHIAEFISDSEPLKAVTRVALKPLVAFAVYALEPELLIEQIPFIIMGASSFVGIIVVGVHSYRKRKIEE